MRLVQVTGRPFIAACCACGIHLYAGDVDYSAFGSSKASRYPVLADLDGKPFQAYYCAVCAQNLKEKTVSA